MWQTLVIAAAIGIIFVAIVVNEIKKKKSGKNSCSCGGNCGVCNGCGEYKK